MSCASLMHTNVFSSRCFCILKKSKEEIRPTAGALKSAAPSTGPEGFLHMWRNWEDELGGFKWNIMVSYVENPSKKPVKTHLIK